jgi:hypothetical protein
MVEGLGLAGWPASRKSRTSPALSAEIGPPLARITDNWRRRLFADAAVDDTAEHSPANRFSRELPQVHFQAPLIELAIGEIRVRMPCTAGASCQRAQNGNVALTAVAILTEPNQASRICDLG